MLNFLNQRDRESISATCHSPFRQARLAFLCRKDIYHTLDIRNWACCIGEEVWPTTSKDRQTVRRAPQEGEKGEKDESTTNKDTYASLEILFRLGMPIYRLPSSPSGHLRYTWLPVRMHPPSYPIGQAAGVKINNVRVPSKSSRYVNSPLNSLRHLSTSLCVPDPADMDTAFST